MPDTKRVEREIRQCRADADATVTVTPVNDNLCHLKGVFKGPEGTVYEGGEFTVDIQLPDEYPFRPPKMKFDTPIYHPNVSSQTGAICLDILKDAWTPVLTLKTALISLQSLLCDPAPNDPQDAQVAKHYLSDRPGFDSTARAWTQKFAVPSASNAKSAVPNDEIGLNQQAIQRLGEMGFERHLVVRALKLTDGDEGRAVEALLSGTM
ncbi:ubiquitin-conjugating enzyme/RWD-like protein [Entophlyctis helioformis]|nr:ubiquitin-conjugating enzyme/RWD-like protein [Entophlyctis helioformis]